jgi:signal transduction histidine kinase
MIAWLKKSIFLRLLSSYILTVLLGLGVVGIFMALYANSYIHDTKMEELLRKAKKVNLAIQNSNEIDGNMEKILFFLDQSFDTRIWIFNRRGEIISTSSKDEVSIGKSVPPTIVKSVLKGEKVVDGLKFEGLSEPMISVAVSWGKESNVYGGIVLHAPVDGMDKTNGRIRETIVWAVLFGILFSAGMGSYLSWSISRPLRTMDRVTTLIGVGNYNERIHIDYTDELGDLANTINKMAVKLEKVEQERFKLEQVRKDFLTNVSHELRTPLTAMQGFLEALQDGLIAQEGVPKYYEILYHETIHMNRLVDDIMDLIQLENEEVILSHEAVEIKSLFDKVAFTYEKEASEKGINIAVHMEEEQLKAYADRVRLDQIILNLVKNAIKFTEKGQITLHGKREGTYVLIQVSDNGIGLSETDKELIWERFFKVDRGRSRKRNGTGVGLAIVKQLVELHQGKIEVESEIGKGSTFSVWIPGVNYS